MKNNKQFTSVGEDYSIALWQCRTPILLRTWEKRVQGATKLLDGSLERCHVAGVEHLDRKVMYKCWRTYAAIDNTSSDEKLFRTTVVSPLI